MPEGPSIILFKRALEVFKGCKVLKASGVSKTIDPTQLQGKTLTGLRTFGKHLLLSFGPRFTLRVHFLMFGTFRFDDVRKAPIRLHLGFGHQQQLNFYTCSLQYIEEPLNHVYDWREDILSSKWDPASALQKLKEEPADRMVCDSLMDQDLFAGLGNIIKNEVLYRTKVHPESLVKSIPANKRKEIVHEVRTYAKQFLKWKEAGSLQKHWEAYMQTTCGRDGAKLIKEPTGKGERRSFWCPVCMKKYE